MWEVKGLILRHESFKVQINEMARLFLVKTQFIILVGRQVAGVAQLGYKLLEQGFIIIIRCVEFIAFVCDPRTLALSSRVSVATQDLPVT